MHAEPLVIRRMLCDDVPQVCAVDALCITPAWSAETFLGEVQSVVGSYWVAELDGRIVGYLGAAIILDEGHIATLGVHPQFRRRHIGERLLVRLMQECLRQQVRRLTLEVRESNRAAQALYAAYGFVPVSRRRGYYQNPDSTTEDAVVMWIDDMTRMGFRSLFTARLAALESLAS